MAINRALVVKRPLATKLRRMLAWALFDAADRLLGVPKHQYRILLHIDERRGGALINMIGSTQALHKAKHYVSVADGMTQVKTEEQ